MKSRKRGVEMKKLGKTDIIGAMLAFFGLAGMAEAVTGHGSYEISVGVFVVGFILCLWGYVK